MKNLFSTKNIINIDLHTVALETEGYVVQDIVDLVDKAIFESYKDRKCIFPLFPKPLMYFRI